MHTGTHMVSLTRPPLCLLLPRLPSLVLAPSAYLLRLADAIRGRAQSFYIRKEGEARLRGLQSQLQRKRQVCCMP